MFCIGLSRVCCVLCYLSRVRGYTIQTDFFIGKHLNVLALLEKEKQTRTKIVHRSEAENLKEVWKIVKEIKKGFANYSKVEYSF